MRRCSSVAALQLKKYLRLAADMKKTGINIQPFLFFPACNAVISKILFLFIFYIKKYVPFIVLHNNRVSTFLIVIQISSIQLPKQTL